MRLLIGLMLFIPLSIGALIYHKCAQNRRNEANIEHNQASETAIPPAVHQPNTQAEHANTYDAGKDCLYRLYLFATIAGVCVALGGIYVIYSQTIATARSAKATEDSVNLQKVAQRQWVNTRNWSTELIDPDKRPEQLAISFDIVNPTRAPIILLWTRITTPKGVNSDSGFPENAMLIPDNPHRIAVTTELTPEQQRAYRSQRGLVIDIAGSIAYRDALEDKREQRFNLHIVCNPTLTVSSDYIHTLHRVT